LQAFWFIKMFEYNLLIRSQIKKTAKLAENRSIRDC